MKYLKKILFVVEVDDVKYVKRIVRNEIVLKYLRIGMNSTDLEKVSFVIGDTDKDDYEEVVKYSENFEIEGIKGIYIILGVHKFVFCCFDKLSALIDECIEPSMRVFVTDDDNIPVIAGTPCPDFLNLIQYDPYMIKYGAKNCPCSIAEWLIGYPDNNIFCLDDNSFVYRYTKDIARSYLLSDKGMTYLAKARLLM